MGRQTQQWSAVGPYCEPELGIESGVEVGQRCGVGFVQAVLEAAPVDPGGPVAVYVAVDQREVGDVLGEA